MASALRDRYVPTSMRTLYAASPRPAVVLNPRWDALLVAVAGFMAVGVGHVHEHLEVLGALRPALVFVALALALYVTGQDGLRRIECLRGPTTLALGAFALWASLSVTSSLNAGVAFTLLVHPFASSVLLYLLAAGSVRGLRDIERLGLVYAVSVALYDGLIFTRFGWHAPDWKLLSLPYYDANDIATLSVTALPIAAYVAVRGPSATRRLLAGGTLVVLALALVRSGSRGGFLAFAAALMCALVVCRSVAFMWRLATVVALVGSLLLVGGQRYWGRLETISAEEADYNWTGDTGRLAVWKRGLTYLKDHPILGLGPNNFPVAEGTISPLAWRQQYNIGVKWSAAHNTYLQVGAELGLPGLAFYLLMLGSGFAAAAAARRLMPAGAAFAEALLVALTGFCVGSFFLSLAYVEFPYVLLGLCVGLHKLARWPGPPVVVSPRRAAVNPGAPATGWVIS